MITIIIIITTIIITIIIIIIIIIISAFAHVHRGMHSVHFLSKLAYVFEVTVHILIHTGMHT